MNFNTEYCAETDTLWFTFHEYSGVYYESDEVIPGVLVDYGADSQITASPRDRLMGPPNG